MKPLAIFGNSNQPLLLLLFVSAILLFLTTQAALQRKNHKIRHNWEKRHKRQGANLPVSYVTSGGNGGPDRGPWSPWGEPSACSRTCNGGVATQQRYCIEPNACSGPTHLHFSCNTQDCTDDEDFRAQQCSEFDAVPFEGIYYKWIPYTKAPNKCELNCMPKGERFYFRHRSQVIDGTKCTKDSLDVCVQGVCQHVGCDRNLGSTAREDKCRQCGGDGSTCNTIRGDLDMTDLQVGYNDILLIPNGAVNILIEEKAPSNNYLAIRNISGFYYLNGNWRIDFPRSNNFAGSTFYYERNSDGFSSPDRITCLGPINEPLYIVLLSQDTNVGVRYEYSISKSVTHTKADDTYAWTYEDFGPCSKRCGGEGFQTRRVACVNQRTQIVAAMNLCDSSQMPAVNKSCGNVPCQPHWVEGPWGECSQQCGDAGEQLRVVTCEQILANNEPSVVPDEQCLSLNLTKPAAQKICKSGVECPKWFAEPWKACDHLCGKGKQKRHVLCYRRVRNRVEIVPDFICERSQQREMPVREKECILEPCEGVDWITSDWTGCEKCGAVKETRSTQCATQQGEVHPDILCDVTRIPLLERKCNETNKCNYLWYASQWTECSAKCGGSSGVQSRSVFCGSYDNDGENLKKVADEKCELGLKYSTEQNCTAKNECTGEWFSGPWSKCSKECGGGQKVRKVLCLKNNQSVDVSECNSETILFSSEQCNIQSCDETTDTEDLMSTSTVSYDDYDEDEEVDCDEQDSEMDEDDEGNDADAELTTSAQTSLLDFENNDVNLLLNRESSFSDADLMLSDSTVTEVTILTTTTATDSDQTTILSTDSSADVSTDVTSSILNYLSTIADISTITSIPETETSSADVLSTSEPTLSANSEVTEASVMSTTSQPIATSTQSEISSISSNDGSTTMISSSAITNQPMEMISESTQTNDMKSDITSTLATIITAQTTESSVITTDALENMSSTTESIDLSTIGLRDNSGTTDSLKESSTTEMTEENDKDAIITTTDTSVTSTSLLTTTLDSIVSTLFSTTSISDIFTTTTPTETTNNNSENLTTSKEEDLTTVTSSTVDTMSRTTDGNDLMSSTMESSSEHELGTVTDSTISTTTESRLGSTTEALVSTIDDWISTTIPAATTTDVTQTEKPIKKCKKRPVKNRRPAACLKSEFGCCHDNKTAATGPFLEGCKIYKTCSETRFGCCADNVTAARGLRGKGCPRVNCRETLFGCCPDKKTAAIGNDNLGCKNTTKTKEEKDENKSAVGNCSKSLFGCCKDGKTPAHGPNQDGCCLKSKNGCCPDFSQAKPLSGECDCMNSFYGCCADNRTYVGAGCDCRATPHGCCLDGVSVAKGPHYDGCHCSTFQFGCCNDGVTIAKGPNGQGCGCQDTADGCCSDNRTWRSSVGNCDCSTSLYQCCLDGETEALGPNFEGCRNKPIVPQDVCRLEKETGSCKNYSVKWYFDMEYGGCSRFWYGGCDGNGNRFETDDDCRKTCVEPQGKDVCLLPQVPGPCEGYYPMWHYDSSRKQCSQFIYRGCLGNNNKFDKREQCEETCPVQGDLDACEQKMDEGPCQGNFSRWYFDKEQQICRPFSYGGCKGTDNNFVSENACKYKCLRSTAQKDICKQENVSQQPTPVLDNNNNDLTECKNGSLQAKWQFSVKDNRCVPFYQYSGCVSRRNQFTTREACESVCPSLNRRSVCTFAAELGECRDYRTRWYYDTKDKRCRQFYYGGCGGNKNNFETELDCLRQCDQEENSRKPIEVIEEPRQRPPEPPQRPQDEFKREFCYEMPETGNCRGSQQKWYFDSSNSRCANFTYGGCGGNRNRFESAEECYYYCASDVCSLPVDVGPCQEFSPRFYYDKARNRCERFDYGGCDGNPNRFDKQSDCESRCVVGEEPQPDRRKPSYISEDVSLCYEPLEQGNCTDSVSKRFEEKWHFDINERKCISFEYSGCGGNRNRFRSEEHCERSCGMYRGMDVCRVGHSDSGECRAAIPKFYYDQASARCMEFSYGGCGGNANRFSSRNECEEVCEGRSKPTDDDLVVGRQRCAEADRQCSVMRCAYGLEKSVDRNECTICKCYDPCERIPCPAQTRCVVEVDRSGRNVSRYVTECRSERKDGMCPFSSDYLETRNCSRECSSDIDCQANLKCCRTSCGGSVCVLPIQTIDFTTEQPQPQSHYFEESDDEIGGEEGGYVTFKCVIKAKYRNPKIIWRKNDLVIDGNLPRYRLKLDGSLQIVNLYKTDSGIYICIANIGEANPVHKEFKLEVSDPVERSASVLETDGGSEAGGDGKDQNVVRVQLGEPTNVQCYAYGWPRPFITWWRNDNMLPLTSEEFEQRDDYSLLIRSTKLSNLGVYTCQAYNGMGKAASWSVTVQTLGPVYNYTDADKPFLQYVVQPQSLSSHQISTFEAQRPMQPSYSVRDFINPSSIAVPVRAHIENSALRTSYREDEDISIECNVEGFPTPSIQWYRNNDPLRTSSTVRILDQKKLMIIGAKVSDTGDYRCSAKNEFSTADSSVRIVVEGIFVHPNCTDNQFFANCKLIVQGRFCTHKYYAKFCCHSCTKAGQLPSFGTHLNQLSAEINN